jgi:hypothetical protein
MSDQSQADNKRDVEAARATAAAVNSAEVLTDTGQKQKRNLLAWAGIAIVLGFYGVPLTQVPWLCLDIPANRQSAAVAVVAAPLIYTFAGFVLYVLSDLKRWRLKADTDFLRVESNTLYRLDANIWRVLSQLDNSVRPAHGTVEQSETIVREALQEAKESMETVRAVRAAAVHLKWLHVFIAYGWELILPGVIGVFALWLSLPPFLHTVAHWPWSETLRLHW